MGQTSQMRLMTANKANVRSSKNLALWYLSIRSRSVKEIKDYLFRKGFDPENIETTLQELIDLGFLNDEKFAQEWVNIRTKTKPCGKIKLKFELKEKGIDQEIIDRVTKLDYSNLIQEAVNRYSKKLIGLDPQKQKQRLAGFLVRRGFSWEEIKQIL